MDYGRILSRAWEIAWRWKILWVLGFLAALGSGSRGVSFEYRFGGEDLPGWVQRWPGWQPSPRTIVWLVVLGLLLLLLGLAFWLVSISARGGLIGGVVQVEEDGSTSFRRAWRVGWDCFWSLLGVAVLTFLPLLLLGLLSLGLGLAAAWGVISGFRGSGFSGLFPLLGVLGCTVPFLVCGFILLVIVLSQLRIYAENAVVLEGLGWIDAVRRAWQVLRENLAPTVIFWLIFLVIGLAVAVVVGGIAGTIFAPFLALFWRTDPSDWPWGALITGGVLVSLLGALIGSVLQTFSSATWTLVYRQIVGIGRAVRVEEAGGSPVP